MKQRVFLWLMLTVFAFPASAQSKNDKALMSVEEKYEAGNYPGAIKALEKFKKKTFKKLGQMNPYTPVYYVYLAKYQLSSGYIQEFESNAQMAITSSATVNKPTSQKHAIVLMDLAHLHARNQSYKQAAELLEEGQKILVDNALVTEELKARYDVDKAEILAGQGYYNEALELLNAREEYYVRRAVKQESYVDDKGALKTRRLTEPEQLQRFNEYARVLTLLGKTLGDRGDQQKSDEYFSRANDWIEKNLGSTSTAAIKNRLYLANSLVEYGVTNARDTDYGKLLNSLKARHAPAHFLGMEIYTGYMKQLIREEASSAKYQNVKLEFEKVVKKAYQENSIHRIRLKAAEFDARLDKAKTKKLEGEAIALMSAPGLPRNNPTTIELLKFLYGLSLYSKNYVNAEKYLNDVIDVKKNLYGEEAPLTHLARALLANYYLDYTNKIAEAVKIYADSYTNVLAAQIGPWQNDHLDILNHMAVMYELTDNYQQAVRVLEQAENVARAKYDNEDRLFAEELTNNARLFIKIGEYEKAEEKLKLAARIMDLKKNDEYKEILIGVIETQAVLYGIKGQFSEAEDELDRSKRIIRKADRLINIDEQATARELSSLLIQLGKYTRTELILNTLIADYERLYGKTSLRLIEPLVNKGKLMLAKGDYTEAERLAQRANQIAVTVYKESSTKTAPTQKLLSDIDYAIGDYDNAERNIAKAAKAFETQFGRQHVETARALSQLSLIKFYKNDNKKEVEKLMTEARETIGKKLGTDNPTYADILKNLAVLYISQKRYPDAFGVLTQAEGIWRAKTGSKNNINAAAIFTLTGDVYYQQKNYTQAEKFYVQAKEIYETYFSATHPEYVKILSKEARVDFMQRDYKRSMKNIEQALNTYESFIKQFFPALSEREKAKYWNTIRPDFEFYNTLAFGRVDEGGRDLSGKVYNYQLLTKALLLSSSIKIRERILNSKNQPLIDAYTKWVQDKEFLTNAQSMSAQQLADNGIDLNALANEIEKLERELSQKSELFGQNFENKRITYENVQKSLAKNEVAVEMVRYRHFDHSFTDSIIYVALYVRNDNGRPKVIELPQGHRMEGGAFKYYRNCIISKIEDERSYKIFWEPIETGVGLYTTLYFSPDGVYNQINLEAIPVPGTAGKYVIDNSNIVLVNNTKDLYLKKLKPKQAPSLKSATMFGNPTFYVSTVGGDVAQLPGTQKEVIELQRLLKQNGWGTSEHVEKSASEDKIKGLDSPSILHIATHGFYSPEVEADTEGLSENEAEMTQNPLLKTGLLLTGAGDILNKTKFNYNVENGILTAYEAMSLNLDKTDLVVLSACETGLGEIANGEGVYGLQRAFLVAGAKVLIMSMFKVDDEATQKLISSFYRKWITTGNQRQSFIEAKKELRVDYPDPIYWGAFMMIGLE
ncbi:MAG: CHAT domain-containing protein [Cyclobacteriaceae bacterium]|jgi:CHAT domain-containing protein|nr:CHAT domain-containing protein [Cyclobacteriaceae bacterium]